MTKLLSELLGVDYLQLQATIRDLESGSGHRSNDIRLATEVMQRTRLKIKQLGLDPKDTTSEELYAALQSRLERDDQIVRQVLKLPKGALSDNFYKDLIEFANHSQDEDQVTFALKHSTAKKLLKKIPPKKAMKQLGYRSVDSLIKHESVLSIYAAAWLCESLAWRKRYLDQYQKLKPTDFEVRRANIVLLSGPRWKDIISQATELKSQQNIMFNELGAVAVLPMSSDVSGLAITSLVTLLSSCNELASVGSYLKLQLVRTDFGQVVRGIAEEEPITSATLNELSVPWKIVHQFYARQLDGGRSEIEFGPHIELNDLRWRSPHAVVASLHPALEFWQDTNYSAYFDQAKGSIVSLNLLDAAINFTHKLPYGDRIRHFANQQLWQELMMRYLDPVNVEQALANQLTPQVQD